MGYFDFLSSTEKEVVANEDSRGVKRDYLESFETKKGDKPLLGERPDFKVDKATEVYKQDPVVRAAVIKTLNKALESGWRLEPQNQKSGVKKLRQLIQDKENGLDYEKLLEEVIGNLVLYNNAFVEVLDGDDERPDVNLLEIEYTEVNTDKNGDVNFYFQDVPEDGNDDQSFPSWEKDEVVHFKLEHFTTNAWSPINLEAVHETVLIKDYIRQWLHWFFKTNQMRPVISAPEGTSDQAMDKLLSSLKSLEDKVDAPLPTKGQVQVQKLQEFADEAESVIQLMDWCDQQILMLMQVPPTIVGQGEEVGKTLGSEMRKQFNGYISSIRRSVSHQMHRELHPKLGASDVKLEWGSVDQTQHKQIFETVRTMRQSQMKPEVIKEYLASQGIVFDQDDVFFDQEELMQMSNDELGTGNESMKGNESSDNAPSRERQVEDDVQRGSQEPSE